jgi:hypothetical protein
MYCEEKHLQAMMGSGMMSKWAKTRLTMISLVGRMIYFV